MKVYKTMSYNRFTQDTYHVVQSILNLVARLSKHGKMHIAPFCFGVMNIIFGSKKVLCAT